MSTLQHESLGKIRGKVGDGVVQYLGIKYGHLKDRFAEATMPIYPSETTLDATKVGPSVIQPPGAVHIEQKNIIQHTLPVTDDSMSDLDGLNLNITVPESTTSKLPVFVFIHGGGFNLGCGAWPEYDFAKLVKFSAEKGVPAIGVSINYRLGVLGLLTSKELRSSGYKSNNTLQDQRLALQWIQKHISGFGGDAGNVTLFGESAGGASVTYHMHCDVPLFKRAMSMSGTDLLAPPVPSASLESAYSAAVDVLGLESKGSNDRISTMCSIPAMELFSKTHGKVAVGGPVIDGETAHSPSFHHNLASGSKPIPASKYCESFMIGDCAFDGSINSIRIGHKKANIASTFCASIEKSLGDHAKELFDCYKLTSSTSDDEAFDAILRFSNDICFHAPTLSYARGLASSGNNKVYVYRFNEPNPWEGKTKGEANHVLDVAFLFLNYNEFLSAEQKTAAEKFAEAFLKFVSGKEPWEEYTKDNEKAAVLEGEKLTVVQDLPEETGRRAGFIKLAGNVAKGLPKQHGADEFGLGLDKLNQAWVNFAVLNK